MKHLNFLYEDEWRAYKWQESRHTTALQHHFNARSESSVVRTPHFALTHELSASWNRILQGKKVLSPKVQVPVHHLFTKWLMTSSSTHWQTPSVLKWEKDILCASSRLAL